MMLLVSTTAIAPAPLYSPTARANLKHAIFTEPGLPENAKDAPRWKFRATGLLFGAIKRTPLYNKIKANAFTKMREATESTGVDWDAVVASYEDVCDEKTLEAIIAEAGPSFATPEYYERPFHAYDEGNLCWEHALHQPLVSRAVGARNLPGMDPTLGDDNFRGAFERELRDMLPADARCRRSGAALLDLGCGTGISTRRLLATFPAARSCVGVDLSPHMVAVGREVLKREGADDPRLSLRLGDAAATGLPDGSVDLACLSLTMHELPAAATDEILAEAGRVLRPGGHLAIFEMDPSSPGFGRIRSNPFVFAALRSTEPYLDDYFWTVAPTLEERINAAGLEIAAPKRVIESNKHQVVLAQKAD